jgi:hypothetical protein
MVTAYRYKYKDEGGRGIHMWPQASVIGNVCKYYFAVYCITAFICSIILDLVFSIYAYTSFLKNSEAYIWYTGT